MEVSWDDKCEETGGDKAKRKTVNLEKLKRNVSSRFPKGK